MQHIYFASPFNVLNSSFWVTHMKIESNLSLRSVAGLVIQATGRTEFEDGLRTGVHLGDCWCPWGGRTYPRINFKPLWGCGLVLGWVWFWFGLVVWALDFRIQ